MVCHAPAAPSAEPPFAASRKGIRSAALALALLAFAACSRTDQPKRASTEAFNALKRACYFTSLPSALHDAPIVSELPLPAVPDGHAIWGSSGRDTQGHLWFGLCTLVSVSDPSARLIEYNPESHQMTVQGDVLTELKRSNLYRAGEGQDKIHTKIFQAADGHLYFASASTHGMELKSGSGTSTWGGHLWRLRMPERKWEHLLAMEEVPIALAGTGRRVYTLCYPGHKLYQYDCQSGEVRSVEVGAVAGHISRNLVSDSWDHVYVPRLLREPGSEQLRATLVEYDASLKQIGETPLQHYVDRSPDNSHGLTAFQPMADASILIVTSLGFMYRIYPSAQGPAKVVEAGWLHPGGPRYVASLFTYDGRDYVMGLATADKDKEYDREYEWVVRRLGTGGATVAPFRVEGPRARSLGGALLYGTVTRDNLGNFYVVGTDYAKGAPLVLQVLCPP